MARTVPFAHTPSPLVHLLQSRFAVTAPVPRAVVVAFWILIGLAAWSLASLVWSAVTFDWSGAGTVTGTVRDGEVAEIAPSAILAATVVVLIFGAIINAVSVLLAFLVRAGGSGARIVVTVFTGLQLVFAVQSGAAGVASAAVAVGAVVLVWLPRSSAYFREVRASRQAFRADRSALRTR